MEPLLGIPQAAYFLGLSPWTVRLHIKKGLLKHLKLGRRILIEPAEIRRFIESHRGDGEEVAAVSSGSVSDLPGPAARFRGK